MTPFDFSTQVTNGSPLPLLAKDFVFGVIGASTAEVDKRGIHCRDYAFVQMKLAVNAVELTLYNGTDAVITAADATGSHTENKNLVSAPGPQTVRFDFEGILLITFESKGELYLKNIS
ncbi:hypothetical protein ACVMFA_002213 [Bradyrhizobium liaoningense]